MAFVHDTAHAWEKKNPCKFMFFPACNVWLLESIWVPWMLDGQKLYVTLVANYHWQSTATSQSEVTNFIWQIICQKCFPPPICIVNPHLVLPRHGSIEFVWKYDTQKNYASKPHFLHRKNDIQLNVSKHISLFSLIIKFTSILSLINTSP
jgi:hypothetical protein